MSNVLVFVEQHKGALRKGSLHGLSFGKLVAQKSGGSLAAVVIGKDIGNAAQELSSYGVKVYSVDGPGFEQYGVEGYTFEQCWEDYAFAMLQVPLVATFGCAYSTNRTERGDRMFAVMVERGCAAIRDLGSLRLAGQ